VIIKQKKANESVVGKNIMGDEIIVWVTLLEWGYRVNRGRIANPFPGREIPDFVKASSGRPGFNAGD
jgi:hypothetical protein